MENSNFKRENSFINEILRYGCAGPGNLLNIMADLGFDRKQCQIAISIGFERGWWHLDENMKLKPGSLWSEYVKEIEGN